MSKYQFTSEMGKISGFGGDYEEACRKMLAAGLEWLDQHPTADPQFHEYAHIYGIIERDNADAEALSKATTAAAPDCSGAMHQAVISTCLWIKANSWDAYVKAMSSH